MQHTRKRLTKRVESQGKKTKVFRYFYLGQTELGCLDEKGFIVELKVPSDPNSPEAAPCVAIEFKKEIYAPLYDLQGNIVCLVDPQKRKIVESYRYSIFGEEEITNERGRIIVDSAVGNSWRYRGKRVDKETGLIYFGQRYYDPKTGRWIGPDPAGDTDGPNLYTFARNNPVTYVDYFGLASEMNENQGKEFLGYFYGEYEPHCHCEQHRTCKRGGDIGSALGGISHGMVDFVVGSLHDLQTMMVYVGSSEMAMTLQERVLMIDAVERSQANQMAAVEGCMMDMLSIDESDAVYQSFRSKTTMGLEVSSLVAGGYGAVKGVIGFRKLVKLPGQVARMSEALGSGVKLNRFHQAARNLSEVGQNNIRVLRGWAKSKGWKKQPNFQGAPEKWGIYQNNKFEWRLVIKPEASARSGLQTGSNIPRFDARLLTDTSGQSYINPFTGEVGTWQVGTHLPLEFNP